MFLKLTWSPETNKNGALPKSLKSRGSSKSHAMKSAVFIMVLLMGFYSAAFADILTLNNQMVFKGKVKKIKDCEVFFKADGHKYVIPSSEIFSIEFEDKEDRIYTHYMKMLASDTTNLCMEGRLDATNFHGKKAVHVALGFLFGGFAMLGTALADPNPYNGQHTALMSKNKEHFNDPEYLMCYKRKAKGQLIAMEGIGWAGWLLLILIL